RRRCWPRSPSGRICPSCTSAPWRATSLASAGCGWRTARSTGRTASGRLTGSSCRPRIGRGGSTRTDSLAPSSPTTSAAPSPSRASTRRPMSDGLDDAQRAAAGRISDLLTELADLVGPRMEPGDLDDDDQPVGQVFLSSWVLVGAWIDEDGDSYLTRVWSPGTPGYQRNGLLHAGLHDFRN